MGKKGREIVKVNVEELITDLNKAYADEWIAYFYYKWAASVATGINAPNIVSELKKIADEEKEHAEELAERILELGGEPERDFEDLSKIANCPKINFPKDLSDLKGILKAVIEAEGCAIEVYNNLIEKLSPCYQKDIKTFHLIEHILAEEIAHEEAFENLL
ncbi:MAG: ferritin-like domain-containing protein [Candidatus Bathyarchaeia archaeon]